MTLRELVVFADGPGEWSITGPTNRDEGATATYTVALSGSYGIGEIVVVDLDLTNISANSSDYGDFIAAINTATVAANPNVSFNSTSGTLTYTSPSDGASMANLVVDLPITNDSFIEGSEDSRDQFECGSQFHRIQCCNQRNELPSHYHHQRHSGNRRELQTVQGNGISQVQSLEMKDSTVQYIISLSGAFGAGEITSVDIGLSDLTQPISPTTEASLPH